MHSRYDRHLVEEPIFGHPDCLLMTIREFFCSGLGCPRRIFTEPPGGIAAKHARTNSRLARTRLAIASALGVEAGVRLAGKSAGPTSPDALLRRAKRAVALSAGIPRFAQ